MLPLLALQRAGSRCRIDSRRERIAGALQRATFQALRCFYAARSYLAAGKPLEALGLFQRTAQRVQEAGAAWDDLERPSTAALAELDALQAQSQVRPRRC